MIQPLDDSVILVADDEPDIRDLLSDMLEPHGATVQMANSGTEALKQVAAQSPDLVILDVGMPDMDGLAVLQQLRTQGNTIPVLMITAQASSTVTIEAMRRGAYDYIAKPFDPDEVLQVVQRAIDHHRLTRRVSQLEQQVGGDARDIMIGRSAAMQQIYKLIGRVADSDATVLITGESGTGKELVAQVLHRSSARREGPFVAVNCAALPETLLESELFGHEKGAFTGAMAQRKGRFEQANKGTLFLDEIGEITTATQKKLLRVLQERTFERVGGNLPVKVDVRVITATNRDLLAEVANGSFRDDLYYRLNVISIPMPPLRERIDDIPLLVNHFLTKRSRRGVPAPRITEDAMQILLNYNWPGNVRQLENMIERAVVMAQGGLVSAEHLQLPDPAAAGDLLLTATLDRLLDRGLGLNGVLNELRAQLVTRAIERSGGNHAAAAALLKVTTDELV